MITINGKEYRNLQEQVQKNMDDIDNLQEKVQTNTEDIDELKNRQVYTKAESDAIFQTKIGMSLYATQQQLNLNIAATEARTDLLLANKQDTLVSAMNIKTINGNSILGSGNINITTNYTAGYGIGITNNIIAIDQNIVATTNMLNGYLKDNDLNYSGTFRGKAIFVKEEGTYTSTSYGDGYIGRNLPYQPGYSYALPNKSGTFALLDDIPSINTLVSKDSDGNVEGILQVEHLQSENWDEDDDNKSDIYLLSGLRTSSILLETGGEEAGSTLRLMGSTEIGSEGYIDLTGQTRIYTSHRIKAYDPDVQGSEETIAYLSDLPATVSGVNNGTNWTSITIGNDTYGIPTGGSGSIVAGTGIDITNGVVSVDNTVAMKTDIPTISGGTGINVSNGVVSVDNAVAMKTDIPTISGGTGISVSNNVVSVDNTVAMKTDIPTISGGTGINVSNGVVSVDNTVAMKTDIPAQTKLYAHKISFNITFAGSNNITGIASIISTSSTQITTATALTTAVRERGVVPASGKYTGSSSANNGRVIELTYGQGSYSQLCAVVVYDYEDIFDVVSIASNTVTDTVTQI